MEVEQKYKDKDGILKLTGLYYLMDRPEQKINVSDFAVKLDTSLRTLQREMDRGKLAFIKVGSQRKVTVKHAVDYVLRYFFPSR